MAPSLFAWGRVTWVKSQWKLYAYPGHFSVEINSEDHDWDNAGWREMAAFSSCVLRPLEWAGLLAETREVRDGKHVHHVFKTPLWRSVLKLDTDDMLQPLLVQ